MCIKLNRVGTLLHIHILSLTILPSPYAIQKGSSRTPLHHALLSAPLPVLHVALPQHQDALAPLHRLLHLCLIALTHTHGSPHQSRQQSAITRRDDLLLQLPHLNGPVVPVLDQDVAYLHLHLAQLRVRETRHDNLVHTHDQKHDHQNDHRASAEIARVAVDRLLVGVQVHSHTTLHGQNGVRLLDEVLIVDGRVGLVLAVTALHGNELGVSLLPLVQRRGVPLVTGERRDDVNEGSVVGNSRLTLIRRADSRMKTARKAHPSDSSRSVLLTKGEEIPFAVRLEHM